MKPRNITIKTVLNGWIVEVGCQTLVFKELLELQKSLEAYMENPKATESAIQENAVNARFFNFAEPVAEDSNLDGVESLFPEPLDGQGP